jgi:transcriptional regulator with XRE-family HTH domain
VTSANRPTSADQTAHLTADTPLITLLRQAMEARAWTIRGLAEASGIPSATVQWTLAGKGNSVPWDTLEPIALALGIPLEVAERAEMESRSAGWVLPPRAQKLSPAGRRALVAHCDWLLEQEQRYRKR